MSDGAKILVVDDDRDIVESMRLVLEHEGYEVLAAYNAEQAMELVRSERPDLILLDVMMPDRTEGFHFVWKLRGLGQKYFEDVPIIVLTAIHAKTALRFYPDSADGTYQAGEYLPVQDFVDKPIEPRSLVEKVRKTLDLSRPS